MLQGFKITLVLVSLLVSDQVFSQAYNLLWDKTYGGDSRDWNCSVTVDDAGNLYLTGDSQTDIAGDKSEPLCNNGTPNADIWIVKTDTAGNILWQRDIGGDSDERFPNLYHLKNPAKEMLLTCFSTSDTACDKSEPNRDTVPLLSSDYWICLLDSNGFKIWDKTLGGDNYDDNVFATVLSSGEILISGESNSPVGYDKSVPNYSISNDIWTLLLDGSGNKIWDKVYGGDGTEFLSSILAESDGSFLLAGTTNSDVSGDVSQPGQGLNDFWMIKVDSNGNKVWDKRFGGTGPDICNYASRTPDNGYILCGFTVSPQGGDVSQPPKGFQDYWVVKTDSAGNKLWDKRFGGSDGSFGTWVSSAQGGGYWIGGYSDSDNLLDVTDPPYGGSDYWILKIDDNGNKLWDKRFGGNGDEYFTGLSILADSAMYAFGYSDTGTSSVKTAPVKGWLDYWLVKFAYVDTTTSINSNPNTILSFSVVPNPSNGEFHVRIESLENAEAVIAVCDLAGRIVYRKEVRLTNGSNNIAVNIENLNAGGYFLNIEQDSGPKLNSKLVIY